MAGPAYRLDHARSELRPQLVDMHFHGVGTDLLLPAIYCFLDRAARDDMVWATRERFTHRKLAAGKDDCLSFQAYPARGGNKHKTSDPQNRLRATAVAAHQPRTPTGPHTQPRGR